MKVGDAKSVLIGSGGKAYNNANIETAINAIAGVGGTVSVTNASDTGFTVTYDGGGWAGTDVPDLGS